MKKSILLIPIIVFLFSCKKDKGKDPRPQNSTSLSISKTEVRGYQDAFSSKIQLTADGTWKIIGQTDWAITSESSGSGSRIINISVKENTGIEPRSTALKVSSGDSTKNIVVYQSGVKVSVFTAGWEGYNKYRIPAIIRLPNGELLAFAEGRTSLADFGNNDIVMKKSSNNGLTWSDLKIVAENGNLQASNSAPVVDLTDPKYPNGRIFLFYNTGNVSETQLRNGNGYRDVLYITSSDNGDTWSAPVNITAQVKKPGWLAYANTPGHAFQFSQGKYKGRIYIAANHSKGTPLSGFRDYRAHGYYTDDHGKTFHVSYNVNFAGSNEATAAELAGGKLMMNIRNQTGDPRCRIVTISNDGGEHWANTYDDHNLPDPVCEGSILNIGWNNDKAILAFCNNADESDRKNLTLRISFDGGKTWTKKYLVDKPGAGTGYSDIVQISKYDVGVFYETDGTKIVFKIINWK